VGVELADRGGGGTDFPGGHLVGRMVVRRGRGDFAGDEGLHVGEGSEVREFLVVDADAEDFLGEHDDLHHREGVEAEVLAEAERAGGRREFGAEIALGEALDDAVDDDGEGRGVGGGAEFARGVVGGRRAALEGFAEDGVVGRGGRGIEGGGVAHGAGWFWQR